MKYVNAYLKIRRKTVKTARDDRNLLASRPTQPRSDRDCEPTARVPEPKLGSLNSAYATQLGNIDIKALSDQISTDAYVRSNGDHIGV